MTMTIKVNVNVNVNTIPVQRPKCHPAGRFLIIEFSNAMFDPLEQVSAIIKKAPSMMLMRGPPGGAPQSTSIISGGVL